MTFWILVPNGEKYKLNRYVEDVGDTSISKWSPTYSVPKIDAVNMSESIIEKLRNIYSY